MKVLPRSIALSLTILVGFLLVPSPSAPASLTLAGNYKITENTDLGSEIRITLQINFINAGSSTLTVTKVGLRSMSVSGQLVTATSSLVVPSHSHSQVSLQFLISKKDFDRWQNGPQQQFLVTFKPTGGKSTLVDLPLLRIQR